MRESQIEAALVARATALGAEVRKVKWIGRNGAPDRLVMHPVHRAWVELKRPGEVPTKRQLLEHTRMRAAGEKVLVIDSLALIDEHFPLP